MLVRGKIFEKNNMVSNDSKLPNSARNAIKKNFLVADGGSFPKKIRLISLKISSELILLVFLGVFCSTNHKN